MAIKPDEESQLPLETRVNLAITEIESLIGPLISRIETKSPGHALGQSKDNHMKEMAEDAASTGALIGLPENDVPLLRLILRTHDIGRFIETDRVLNTLRPGARHGQLSVDFIQDTLTKYLTPRESNVIAFAVKNHSESAAVLTDNLNHFQGEGREMAEAFCYLLRDMDTMERLENSRKFLMPSGIFEQLKAHYTNKDLRQPLTLPTDETQVRSCIQYIEALLHENQPALPKNIDNATATRLAEILNGDISLSGLEQLSRGQTMNIGEVSHSYSNYMLLQLATLFDVHTPALLEEIYNFREKYLFPRLSFIRRKVSDQEYGQVVNSLTDFFSEKLSYDNITKEVIAEALRSCS